MKKTYQVEIMGQRFNLKSEESQEHVNKVVNYVTDKMKTISKDSKTLSIHHATILSLLNVADELFQSRKEVDIYKTSLVQKTKNIIDLIDEESR